MAADIKPVIFLAFANDREETVQYLRNLPEEARRLQAVLDQAAQRGLCELVVRQNASLQDIAGVFLDARYHDRIAIFHYGGHADTYGLLLESSGGDLAVLEAGNLAAFLAAQRALQLVFLNGCATYEQAAGLLDAKVAAVITTLQTIEDTTATDFAGYFYQGLAGGQSIRTSYEQASAALKLAHGSNLAELYGESSEAGVVNGLPWVLEHQPGAEVVVEWNLPDATRNPLFGIPSPPERPLPDRPYHRALSWYTREHAELFFGRGHQIGDLYRRLTAPGSAPVLLFYGQSGVGKSSLLDAGLFPRLEQVASVCFARRDRTLGLLGTLRAALDAGPHSDLARRWHSREKKHEKPLVVLLDQVEELFTLPQPDEPDELSALAGAARAIFNGSKPPQGKLVLSFRKERLAEIERVLRDHAIPTSKVFLQPLDHAGVREVVLGPASTPRLRDRYNLNVDEDTAELVANDLTRDPDSPVATVLHLIMNRMWDAATARSSSSPAFDAELYEAQRIDLRRFLDEQLATFAQSHPDAAASGLIVDLLYFHTTSLGSAEQRTQAEVRGAYAHRTDLDAIVQRAKDLYLLTDPAGEHSADRNAGASRLAHDTLAPHVRREFARSERPGQRARRLLESHWTNEDGAIDETSVLDDADLGWVERGEPGMRVRTAAEEVLVTRSRAQRVRRRRVRTILWALAAVAVAVIAISAGVAWYLKGVADDNAERAQMAQTRADQQREVAEQEKVRADENAAEAEAQRLAAERQRVAAEAQRDVALRNDSLRLANLSRQQLASDPVASLHLALAALPVTAERPLVPEAESALRQAILTSRERQHIATAVTLPDQVAVHDGSIAVAGNAIDLYTLGETLTHSATIWPRDIGYVQGVRWGADGRLLAWDRISVYLFEKDGVVRNKEVGQGFRGVLCAEWQPQQEWIAVCADGALYVWNLDTDEVIEATISLETEGSDTQTHRALWSPDGTLLAGAASQLAVWNSTRPDEPAFVLNAGAAAGSFVDALFWDHDSRRLAAEWVGETALFVWEAGQPALERIDAAAIGSALAAPRLAGLPDGRVDLLLVWDTSGVELWQNLGAQIVTMSAAPPFLVSLAPDGARFAAASETGIELWDIALPDQPVNRMANPGAERVDVLQWLDAETLLAQDGSHILHVIDASNGYGIVPVVLAGMAGNEILLDAWPLPGGRVLTASYDWAVSEEQPTTLRVWQADASPIADLGELIGSDICMQVQRSLDVPAAVDVPRTVHWTDGGVLLLGDRMGQALHWNAAQGEPVLLAPPAEPAMRSIVFSPDGSWLFRYRYNGSGELARYQLGEWQPLPTPRMVNTFTAVETASWPDESLLVSPTGGPTLLFEPDRGTLTELQPAQAGAHVRAVALPGDRLAVGYRTGRVQLWDVAGRKELASWDAPDGQPISSLSASADGGQLLVTYANSGDLSLIDTQTHALLWTLPGTGAVVDGYSVLHPRHPLLATINDGILRIYTPGRAAPLWSSTESDRYRAWFFKRATWSQDGAALLTTEQALEGARYREKATLWEWRTAPESLSLLQEFDDAADAWWGPTRDVVLTWSQFRPQPEQYRVTPTWLGNSRTLFDNARDECLRTRSLTAEQKLDFVIDGDRR